MKTISVGWFITGYHLFQKRPENNEEMKMYAEKNNIVDPWAVLVKDKKGNIIGRVPANLCRAILKLKESRLASNFKCKYANEVIRPPNHDQRFKRSFNGGFDSARGGAVLKCLYSFDYEEDKFESVAKLVKENVPGKEMYRFS